MDMSEKRTVAIIGGGAAGLMAAAYAAEIRDPDTDEILLIEQNDRMGKKLRITGKGRCNLTNDCDRDEFLSNVPTNPRFLYASLAGFDTKDTQEYFESLGVPLKVERGKRVFPVSDKAGDVVEALVRDTAMFGQDLVMKRRITSDIGGDCIVVEDSLTNLSFKEQNYCLLYHVNVGYPMLDAGAEVRLNEKSCCGRTPWATQNMESRFEMEEPVVDTEETCYFIEMNEPRAGIVNKTIGKEFVLDYSGDTLPCFVEWKCMVSGDYALGLEPCSCLLDDRFAYSTIQAGQTIDFKLKLSVREL